MKADLNSLKRELGRLADTDYLKKELNRIRQEVKTFDLQAHLTPAAKQRVKRLEKRWKELLKQLAVLQKQVDQNLSKFRKVVKARAARSSAATATTTRKSAKKSTRKKTSRKSS